MRDVDMAGTGTGEMEELVWEAVMVEDMDRTSANEICGM